MEDELLTGDPFGQRAPPLTDVIKSILERYPDGGQILKELIQNADDAGATKVKFLYDSRSYDTRSLLSPKLSKFQGPALYAYNNAKFNERDWEGIQSLMQSNKKDDPLKVGRFGIGFNSVYHITDLPGIVSGKSVVFLDPHETYFGPRESGRKFKISAGLLGPRSRDQFAPFHDIFGCNLADCDTFEGTLFRFPLRTVRSQLSKKNYTKEMVDGLFESLREESSSILLFLKNVHSIGVYERTEDGKIECVFNAKIAKDRRAEVKSKRQQLLRQASKASVTEFKCVIDVQVTSGARTQNFRWFVLNRIGSATKLVREMAVELCLLPWVGFAVPLNALSVNAGTGRVFCFLPLPADVDCETGLPVHVHGYFGLTDNRRGLAWPGPDCQNNEMAKWNKLLLAKAGSVAYCKILEALIRNEPHINIDQGKRAQLVYSTLPNLSNVRGHWRCILEPLFTQLVDQDLFYAKGIFENSWITLTDGILDRLQQSGIAAEVRNVIMKILVWYRFDPVVISDVPDHVLQIIDHYFDKPDEVTPELVKRVLKGHNISTMTREDKLLLLEYVVNHGKNSDLSGIPLLPLANGQFIEFQPHKHVSDPSTSIFVPRENCPAALLPNMPSRFLDENIPTGVKSKLSAMASSKIKSMQSTQLVFLTKEIVAENLRSSLPSEWLRFPRLEKVSWTPGKPNHPPELWLEMIWWWIHTSFPSTLVRFEELPLIPLSKRPQRTLGVLSSRSKFIFSSDVYGSSLPTAVIKFLTSCGCTVLSHVEPYLRHPDISSYIAPPTPAGFLTVLRLVNIRTVEEQMARHATSSDRAVFRTFMSHLPAISDQQKLLLHHLPLFNSLHGTSTAVQVKNRTLVAVSSNLRLPSGFRLLQGDKIISNADASTLKLLSLMNVEILQPAEIFVQYLFPDIGTNSSYSDQETDLIMQWILEEIVTLGFQSDAFLECLRDLPFVPTKGGQRKRARELYDVNDDVLRNLFAEEPDAFPASTFAHKNVITTLIHYLGLRTRSTLSAVDVSTCAETIASRRISPLSIRKAKALMEILNSNSNLLNQPLRYHNTLKDKLCHLKWIPCCMNPPQNYPDFMSWSRRTDLFSPSEMRSLSKVLLIGSSMPTPGVDINPALQHELGLTLDPPFHQVVNQLKVAITSWKRHTGRTTSMTLAKFQELLTEVYLHLSTYSPLGVQAALTQASLNEWIWEGEDFCSPKQIALRKDFTLDLRPQLFLLPKEFRDNRSLITFFQQHGVRRNFTEGDILEVLGAIRKKHTEFLAGETSSKEVEKDLELCRAILQWVVRDRKTLSEELQEKVYVPIQSRRNVLALEPCKKCTYCDRDWFRRGGSELDIPGNSHVIHETVSTEVARLLGVPALSTCILSAEPWGFEEAGPHEPITTRLSNILKEYKDGVGIFKELIQNADDAGATKVRFLVDWRTGPTEKLLSPNMAVCQGPALWSYNDAKFTDRDFENINKLAGATKIDELGKIGRFGLGFSAVYHLTDIPSFVSREYFVIFDPNVTHLQTHIHDKSRPGIRTNLATNPTPLSAFEDQFQPYHNVFGCNTKVDNKKPFYCDGTLFRFPFRTLHEANDSEISQRVYDEKKVKYIVKSLKETAEFLLLFTQHVNQVELYETKKGCDPRNMQLVLSVTKDVSQILHSENSSSRRPFVEDCVNWWQKKMTIPYEVDGPSRWERLTIDMKSMPSNLTAVVKKAVNRDMWLSHSCVGTNSSLALASREYHKHRLLPCAGTAAKLSVISGTSKLRIHPVAGEAFCFLPLSIPTGLPIHVNGYFAITSNRRDMWEKRTSDLYDPVEVQWNECLMEDALCNAYVQLLKDMKSFSENEQIEQCDFHELWPRIDTLKSITWEKLARSFYTKLVEEAVQLFHSDGRWLSIHDGYFIDEPMSSIPEIAESLKLLGEHVFQVPSEVRASLEKSGQQEVLQQRSLDLETFFKSFFFPNISVIPQKIRDRVVCKGLDSILNGQEQFLSSFKEYACITCSTDGRHLAKPCELIDPNGAAAKLFSNEDCRFPIGEHFLTTNRMHVLEQLGMVKDQLPWCEICERAKSIEKLASQSYENGKDRAKKIIKYLKENIEKYPREDERSKILQSTKFLPFMSKPPEWYSLPWKGSEYNAHQLFAPRELFMSSDLHLVGSSSLFTDTSDSGCGKLGQKVKDLLGLSKHRPEVEQVLQQLDVTINFWSGVRDKKAKEAKRMVDSVCNSIYKYLNAFISRTMQRKRSQQTMKIEKVKEQDDLVVVEHLVEKLNARSWIFIQGQFVSKEKVACDWSGNAAPFLYGLPHEYPDQYNNLFEITGVKRKFDVVDFINSLYELQESKKLTPLKNEELKVTVCLVNELKEVDESFLEKYVGLIPLPDTSQVLCQCNQLTVNHKTGLEDDEDARYVHEDILPQLALKLGAKSLKDRILEKFANVIGIPFGQHEDLTDRLRNILNSYPCDSGILKELVQNADDAEATEIHFIYDTRVLPDEHALQKNAKEVQGPALCVYNNRPFKDEDLKGITKLGIGSKGNDPEKTGQFGIGFNAVYHLTDCPSFLSNDDTLCFLDPECRYAPGATSKFPGVKFQGINQRFKENFKDVFPGYLSEMNFDLKGATMFRLPLRTPKRAKKSLICNTWPSDFKMMCLLNTFEREAKKILLFLNHVRKISLSKIDERGKIQLKYQATSVIDVEEEKERQEDLPGLIKTYKDTPTCDIPWNGSTYRMTLSDSSRIVEEWLVHQCLGTTQFDNETIPDGRPYGLFPRGGVAALVSTSRTLTYQTKPKYAAYCFLPLPVTTSLPVHVNGHFALNASRRALWQDTDSEGPLTRWNNFIKSRVLAPGYAALLYEARNYIPLRKTKSDKKCYFSNFSDAQEGMQWYHNLFPSCHSSDPAWEILVTELYRYLGTTDKPVLPVVAADEEQITQTISPKQDLYPPSKDDPQTVRGWLPAQAVFFMEKLEPPNHCSSKPFEPPNRCWELLLRIGLPLLMHTPPFIQAGFQRAAVDSSFVTPKGVIDFLRKWESPCITKSGKLPCKLEDTRFRTAEGLKVLITYCKQEKEFLSLLEGLPLLLTADGLLRVFDSCNPVYRSKFSDLFPDQAHLFVHPKLVSKLPTPAKDLSTVQVLRHFSVESLALLMPNVFPQNMIGITRHLHWSFPDRGVLSEKWFRRLWEFLEGNSQKQKHGAKAFLDPLGKWPIIPTACGKLVTVDNAKTVLDTKQGKTENARGKKIREILEKLECPSLNKDITTNAQKVKPGFPGSSLVSSVYKYFTTPNATTTDQESTDKPRVTDDYVAHPHNVTDVLQVLDYMTESNTFDEAKLSEIEIREMLMFFQDDYPGLEPKFNDVLKSLPFYKAMDGTHYSLFTFSSYAIVPSDIPASEIEKLQRCTDCLFLHSDAAPALDSLYKGLGTGVERSISEFYSKYVLPSFHVFSRESQINYLIHIKNRVIPILSITAREELWDDSAEELEDFLNVLRSTPCVPDLCGNLHRAREFHDPCNEVFKIMLEGMPNQFPPPPFCDEEWLSFLTDIDLKTDVDKEQFLEFCNKVENTANQCKGDKNNTQRSQVLVRYLLTEKHLHEKPFLSSVSKIKFIASENVETALLSLHIQYQCDEKTKEAAFVQFFNSVPWIYQELVWTSAPILPDWVEPSERLMKSLGVQQKPSPKAVITHLQQISFTLAEISKKDKALPKPEVVKEVMNSIYDYLNETCNCGNLRQRCITLVSRLKNVPCILVEDGNTLVNGEQLTFATPCLSQLHPFLYIVPRQYGRLEHFLKRLGTTEEVTTLQLAKVLKALKDRCKDTKMNPDYEQKACNAMRMLVEAAVNEQRLGKQPCNISYLTELYLPSEDKFLIKSNELVCKVPPSLYKTVSNLNYHSVSPIENCELPRELLDEFLKVLPNNLRPLPLKTILCEKVDPSCLDKTCELCQGNRTCEFIGRYSLILKSKEFQEGLLRLMKHQKNSNDLTEEEKEKSLRLRSPKTEIKCMATIKTHLFVTKTEESLDNSSQERPCYVVREDDSWTLYIQHGEGGKNNEMLSKCVNRILDKCFHDTNCCLAMSAILSCDVPSQISGDLDKHEIARDIERKNYRLGQKVPVVFHHLMQQNPLFVFREGEIVGYAVELQEEEYEEEDQAEESLVDEEEENNKEEGLMKYILAKIVTRPVKQFNEGGSPFDFTAAYRIDIGSEKKEVSVLDLYKFCQYDPEEDQTYHMLLHSGNTSSALKDIEEEKCKIREALQEAKRLPIEMRRRVIKRLYLCWHPDKNPDNVEFATEVMKFLVNEIEQMEEGYSLSDLFQCCDEQATKDKNIRQNFRDADHGLDSLFFDTYTYKAPDRREAKRWMAQSCSDLEAAESLISEHRSFTALACFLSQQVVEKCLKAALYAKCGVKDEQLHDHDVYRLARDVSQLKNAPSEVVALALVVDNYYIPTRYPNRHPQYIVPARTYNTDQSKEAIDAARKLITTVKEFID